MAIHHPEPGDKICDYEYVGNKTEKYLSSFFLIL